MCKKLRNQFCYVLLVVVIGAPAVGADGVAVAVPVLSEQFAGQLVGVSEDWQVTFSTGEAERRLPLRQLVRWGNYSFAIETRIHCEICYL